MQNFRTRNRPACERRGAALVLIVFLLVVFLIAVAFSVDLARVQLAQLELQSTADIAARAGAEAIARGVGDPVDNSITDADVRAEIEMVSELNRTGGAPVMLAPADDIVFGYGTDMPTGYEFTETGSFSSVTDAVRVKPQLPDFPLFFGAFLGTTSFDLSRQASAIVQERDIVLILDRSASMLDHDAGVIHTSNYPPNLMSLRDDMFGPGDRYFPGGSRANSERYSEFEITGAVIHLSKMQALQLAVYRFRQAIDQSRGHEKLGLVTYAEFADSPIEADPAPGMVDIDAGLSAMVRDAIVLDGITKAHDSSPYRHIDERYAASLEAGPYYNNFDYNVLAMRWCEQTNISDGIDKGTDVLFGAGRRAFATPILILMTDGRHTKDESGTPEARLATELALHPEMEFYAISFGDNADKDLMEDLADLADGEWYHANDVSTLVDAFEEIARTAGVTLIE